MQWKRKQDGDIKFRKRFILFPEAYGEHMVWLESIYEKVVVLDGPSYWRGLAGLRVSSATKEKIAELITSDNEHSRDLAEFIWKKEGFE